MLNSLGGWGVLNQLSMEHGLLKKIVVIMTTGVRLATECHIFPEHEKGNIKKKGGTAKTAINDAFFVV